MDFWRTALDAAERARSVAKVVSQRGLEIAEATAEEAGKKLKDLNLHDTVGTAGPQPPPPSPQELAAYGINPTFTEFIRSLNYSTFRDFPSEHLPCGPDGTVAAASLNSWQVRHATLVVQSVEEVKELRYVLCPRYMDDQRFWAVYFTLVRRHLPDVAYAWVPGDELPPLASDNSGTGVEGFMSLAGLGSQLRTLSNKLQQATVQTGGPAGLELTSFFAGASSAAARAFSTQTSAGVADDIARDGGSAAQQPMLASDPDLEAYLRVGGSDGGDGSAASGEGSDVAAGDDDLDLDKYLNELSQEVGDEEEEEEEEEADGDEASSADVDAALQELAEQEHEDEEV